MNLAFNELSFRPFADSPQGLFQKMCDLYALFAAVKRLQKFDHVIFPSHFASLEVLPELTFAQWLANCKSSLQTQQIRSMLRRPFEAEALEDRTAELDAYYFDDDTVAIKQEPCIGLGIAALLGTMSLSLATHPLWEEQYVRIRKLKHEINSDPEELNVRNVSTIKECQSAELIAFVESLGKVELIECMDVPEEKSISLRDDHGKDVLLAFGKKIRQSPYVVSIVNSLPFNPRQVRFIQKVQPNGLLEVVLFWEDKGLGMVIQTTGRTVRETQAIAKLLEKKFSK